MPRISHSFSIAAEPGAAQDRFVRDILPTIYKATSFRLTDERPGLLVFSDGAVDVHRAFDPRRVIEGEGVPRRHTPADPAQSPPQQARPRLMGVLAPNVEHRRPWLYATLRRAGSRRLRVSFETAGEGRTEVRIDGRAERRLRDALSRLGQPGRWPDVQDL